MRDNCKVRDATIIIEVTRAKAYPARGILRLISPARRGALIVGTRAHIFPGARDRTQRISASFNSRLSVGKQYTASRIPLARAFV